MVDTITLSDINNTEAYPAGDNLVTGSNKINANNALIAAEINKVKYGIGSPEGAVTAVVNTRYLQTDNSNFWIKMSGSGNTGWARINAFEVPGITLDKDNWSLVSGFYEYDLANSNISALSSVDIIPNNADISIVRAALILPYTLSSAGSVKIYANNAPTDDIGVTLRIKGVCS